VASAIATRWPAPGGAVIEDTVRRYVEATERYRALSEGLGPQSNSGPPFPAHLFRLIPVNDLERVEGLVPDRPVVRS
jgi:hypothetical protein